MAPGGGLEPPTNPVSAYHWYGGTREASISQELYGCDMVVSPPSMYGYMDATRTVEFIVNDPEFKLYLKERYRRDFARCLYRNAKLLPKILRNPAYLKQLSYRKAKAVIESVTPLKDFAKIKYGILLGKYIDTKLLRKHLPERKSSEVTNAIIEFELKTDPEKRKTIIEQAVTAAEKMPPGKWKLAVITDFFTGLRASEVSFIFNNWGKLKKIDLGETVMIEINYERKTKNAYITLIPKKLYEILSKYLPLKLHAINWLDNIRSKYGVKISIFRKAFNAITATYLDSAERDLLQGRLSATQVKHYIKHIIEISKRYIEAYRPYLKILDKLEEELKEINLF